MHMQIPFSSLLVLSVNQFETKFLTHNALLEMNQVLRLLSFFAPSLLWHKNDHRGKTNLWSKMCYMIKFEPNSIKNK